MALDNISRMRRNAPTQTPAITHKNAVKQLPKLRGSPLKK